MELQQRNLIFNLTATVSMCDFKAITAKSSGAYENRVRSLLSALLHTRFTVYKSHDLRRSQVRQHKLKVWFRYIWPRLRVRFQLCRVSCKSPKWFLLCRYWCWLTRLLEFGWCRLFRFCPFHVGRATRLKIAVPIQAIWQMVNKRGSQADALTESNNQYAPVFVWGRWVKQ